MIRITLLLMVASFLTSCSSTPTVQTTALIGTQITTDEDGYFEHVTYVSPEEFEAMTPKERRRLGARVGVSKKYTWTLGNKKKKTHEAEVQDPEERSVEPD